MTSFRRFLRVFPIVLALAVVAAACGDDDDSETSEDSSSDPVDDGSSADTPTESAEIEGALEGVFAIEAGDCTEGTVTSGSYFRMLNPGGTLEDGEFLANGDSPCSDQTWIPLTPGAEGGLDTGAVQAAPDPAFDATGNGLAADVIEPVTFFGVGFAVGIDGSAPISGEDAVPPRLEAIDGNLGGEISGWTAFYGNEEFNQGSPKPDGSAPGLTAGPSGTIDPESGEYVLDWTSQIVGGAFDNFTGVWHLEGTFVPA